MYSPAHHLEGATAGSNSHPASFCDATAMVCIQWSARVNLMTLSGSSPQLPKERQLQTLLKSKILVTHLDDDFIR
jgi:hypothetical protein